MSLNQLGWNETREVEFEPSRSEGLVPARVAAEDKHFYRLWTADSEVLAQVTGKILHDARLDKTKLPKVGDWVGIRLQGVEQKGTIHCVLSRSTQLSRKAAGRDTVEQVLATNVDKAFIVVAADASYNPARLERMLVMVRESGALPIVVLNKIDLCPNSDLMQTEVASVAQKVPVLAVCGKTGRGIKQLRDVLEVGQTIVFLGTSGVGKSTLINRLYGEKIQPTMQVREGDAKGRHTTTCREMVFLPNGGVVIDTPGMREFHLWAAGNALAEAYPEIEDLVSQCHFRDCTHTQEAKCAVLVAVKDGRIIRARYEGFIKIQREKKFLQETERQKHWQDRKGRHRKAHRVFNKND